MRSTGIVRKIDQLGRIVIPIEARRAMGIEVETPMEFFADLEKGEIVLKAYKPGCVFCDNVETTIVFRGQKLCAECVQKILKRRGAQAI